jgi:hypothetical protein
VVSDQEFGFLVGLELSGVSFVRDYVEFVFDGPVLRVMSEPEVHLVDRSGTFPNPPFRDLACELIGSTITSVNADVDGLTIAFERGATIRVPFGSVEAGPEVVHFVPWLDGSLDVGSMRIWENRSS